MGKLLNGIKRIIFWKDKYKNSIVKEKAIEFHSFKGWFKREIIKCYFGKETNNRRYVCKKLRTIPNLFHIYIENPFKTWWKVRKYFRLPKIVPFIHKITTISGYPYASHIHMGKILDIQIHDVWWKDKYNSPRHECNPIIYIGLFKKIAFGFRFIVSYKDEFNETCNGDMEYWEYILEYLYYKDEKTLKCYSTWTGDSRLYKHVEKYGVAEDGSGDILKSYKYITPVVAMSLNKCGINKLKEELNEQTTNN